MNDQSSFLASRFMHGCIVLIGSLLLTAGVLQLPLSVIQYNTRATLPFRLTRITAEGMEVSLLGTNQVGDGYLRNGDIARSLNGVKLDSANLEYLELMRVITRTKPGDVARIEVFREGKNLTVLLPLSKTIQESTPTGMLVLNYLIGIIAPIIMFVIGLIVVLNRPRNRVAALNFFTLASIGCYLLFEPLLGSLLYWDLPGATSLWYLANFSFILCFPLLLHFFLVFPRERLLRGSVAMRNTLIYLPYMVLFGVEILVFGPFGFAAESQLPLVYGMYAAYGLSPFIGIVFLFISYRQAPTKHLRRVVRTMIVGLVVFSISSLASFFVGAFMQWFDLSIDVVLVLRIGFLFFMTFSLPLAFAVAIFRYGYLDVNVLFRRAVIYILFSLTLTTILLGGYRLLMEYGGNISTTETLLLVGVLTALVTTAFTGVRDRFQMAIDRMLFRKELGLAESVQHVNHELLGVLSTSELQRRLIHDIPALFHLGSASVLQLHSDAPAVFLAGDPCDPSDLAPVLTHPRIMDALERNEAVQASALLPTIHKAEAAVLLGLDVRDHSGRCIVYGEKVSGRSVTSREMMLFQSIAEYAAMAWRNAVVTEELQDRTRLKRDMEIAHEIQTSMLPRSMPNIQGMGVAAFSIAAAEVGGDFHDFVQLKDGKPGIVVGDVSDKGVSAALVMASTISVARLAAGEAVSPRELLERINDRMYLDTRRNMFVAMLAGVIDESARSFTFSNAGLPKPMVCRDGECYLVDWSTDGDHLALGLQPEVHYHEQTISLKKDDLLLVMSDGLLESPNYDGEEFGVRNLRDVVLENRNGSAQTVADAIREALEKHRNYQPIEDDISLVVLRVTD